MFFENVRLAFKDFGANKLRTFLSILGIVIGVGSVIAITTLGRSATASVQAEVARAGLNVIAVFPGRDSAREVRRLFTPELARKVAAGVEGVREVVPINSGSYLLKRGRETTQANAVGVDETFADLFDYAPAEGGFITAEQNQRRNTVIVLGAQVAQELFPGGQAMGQYVRLSRKDVARSFKVVGVMRSKTATMGMDFDASVYVPYQTYTRRVEPAENVQRYFIGARRGADVLQVADRVDRYFLQLTGNEDSYRVISPATMAEVFTGVTRTLNLFLTGVAAISLLVGGIGIMNIMLVSVTERTREVGIRKALGASPGVIRGQFLTEAVVLTLVGGVIGIVLGTGLSYAGTLFLKWVFAPQLSAFAVAVAVASAVGIFFGLYPAVRASRLDPVAALAFE